MPYNHKEIENQVFMFWQDYDIYGKVKEKNKTRQKFYFLDGPPYTSGHIHLGTAWNKVLKDFVLRYKRMRGYNVFDRAGYDMHGLPIENRVMKELKLKTKKEIEQYSVEKFVRKCEEFAVKNMKEMNREFSRLAVWMDFSNAYQSIKPEFISGVWFLIKKAYEQNRLYRGQRTVTWCKHCETNLAKHELEYETVTDTSIYVKFKIKGKDNEYLVIWTTTPWTIPFNLGIMVNPEIEYSKCKVQWQGKEEYWYVAKNMANIFISAVANAKYEIVETMLGEQLDGIEYEHPFYEEMKEIYDELKKQSSRVHTVVLSKEYVDLSAGTGLVHMAPGCGPEDYEVGLKYGIPPYNNVDERGRFTEGKFKGMIAKDDDSKFIELLKQKQAIIAEVPVEHEYPFCQRCHNPVIFRTTEQWFLKVQDFVKEMRENNKSVYWVPEWAGTRAFDSWLSNLRDNSITRQRFWGTPVPIWICENCGHVEVIGSLDELREKSITSVPMDLHKPWIDEVKLRCPKCNSIMHRLPDVLDVWVDAGTASWNDLNYPQTEDLFEKYFPADFILEGKDQIRGWFNLLVISAMLAFRKQPFKAVYMHGFVNDEQGEKMSKSLGNIIRPMQVVDEIGVDALRLYMIQAARAGEDLNFSIDEAMNKKRNLNILVNSVNYLLQLIENSNLKEKTNDFAFDEKSLLKYRHKLGVQEKYILSRLHDTIGKVTELLEKYRLDEVPGVVEQLFLDISTKFIKTTREKVSESEESREVVINVLAYVLFNTLKLLAPITPVLAEYLYQKLRPYGLKEESIHLYSWPESKKEWINKEIEKQFMLALDIVSLVLKKRDEIRRNVRWPIKAMLINVALDDEIKELVASIANIKNIEYEDKHNIMKKSKQGMVVDEDERITLWLDLTMNEELMKEGFLRELIRRIQMARKQLGLNKRNRILLDFSGDDIFEDLKSYYSEEIMNKVGAERIHAFEEDPDYSKEYTINGKKLKVKIKVLR